MSQIHGFFYSSDIILLSLVIRFIYPRERKLEDNVRRIRCNNCCKIKELIIKKERNCRKRCRKYPQMKTSHTSQNLSILVTSEFRKITLCTLIDPQGLTAFQSIFFSPPFYSPASSLSSNYTVLQFCKLGKFFPTLRLCSRFSLCLEFFPPILHMATFSFFKTQFIQQLTIWAFSKYLLNK